MKFDQDERLSFATKMSFATKCLCYNAIKTKDCHLLLLQNFKHVIWQWIIFLYTKILASFCHSIDIKLYLVPSWSIQCRELSSDSFFFSFVLHNIPILWYTSYWNELHLWLSMHDLATKSMLPLMLTRWSISSEHTPSEHWYRTIK